jgi:hypothetical protein
MKPIHHLPRSGVLPWSGRRVEALPMSNIISGRGKVGFVFYNRAGHRDIHLNWSVVTKLTRVRTDGTSTGEMNIYRRALRTLPVDRPQEIAIVVARTPKFYRLDISIVTEAGSKLGHYAEYFRVVPLQLNVRLLLKQQMMYPGAAIVTKVVNPGTESVFYGEEYDIQRYNGQTWIRDPLLTPSGFVQSGTFLTAGQSGACEVIKLPENVEPGQFRFIKPYSARSANGRQRTLRAEFSILSKSAVMGIKSDNKAL